jgi:hypothetical protein
MNDKFIEKCSNMCNADQIFELNTFIDEPRTKKYIQYTSHKDQFVTIINSFYSFFSW